MKHIQTSHIVCANISIGVVAKKNKWLIAILLIFNVILPVQAVRQDLTGKWNGPKDLMINLCTNGNGGLYVCYCGIFRTFGWADVVLMEDGDSLIMTANDAGSPFEARLHIESSDTLIGTITMGTSEEEWFYGGKAMLVKQKPIIPEQLNHELEGIIHPSDYGVLALDRDIVWNALSAVSPTMYGYAEKGMIKRLLEAKIYPITPDDLMELCHVRSIQIDGNLGLFSYPYFKCRSWKKDGKVFFEKITGSQRKSGYVYQNSSESLIFLGGWSVNDDPQASYESTNSVAGTIYKIGENRVIMLFPANNNRVEIYELKK